MRFLIAVSLAALWLTGGAAAKGPFEDCNTPAFAIGAARDGAFKCVEIHQQTYPIHDREAYVRTLRDAIDDRSDMYEPTVMQAAEAGLNLFSSMRAFRYGRFTFIFQPVIKGMEKDGQYYAFAHPYGDKVTANAECIIQINTARHDNTTDDVLNELSNSVVHEMFHCMQYWNWTAKMDEAFKADSRWWIEGSAELIGHVAFESAASRDKRIKEFHDAIQTTPLTRLTYPNFVFFSWLWGKSPNAVLKLLDAMPETGGEDAQRAALAKTVGDYDLGLFATDYADGKIRTPDGAPISAAPYARARTISEGGQSGFEFTPMAVVIEDVSFTGGQYMASPKGKASMFYKRKTNAPEQWQTPMIVSADGPCGEPKVFRFAGMAMGAEGGDSESWTLDVTKLSPCQECVPDQVRDACLLGQWRATNSSIADAIMKNAEGGLTEIQVSGITAMRMRTNGEHHFGWANVAIEGKPTGAEKPGLFRIYLAGTIDSLWSGANGNMKLCYKKSDAVMQTTVRGAITDPISIEDMVTATGDTTQLWTYDCQGDKLTIKGQIGLDHFSIDFEKVGPP